MFRPFKTLTAIRALKAADEALDAYIAQVTTNSTRYRYLYAAVETAYDSPYLPDRYRDPRDAADRKAGAR